jgi:hypothetical protein
LVELADSLDVGRHDLPQRPVQLWVVFIAPDAR